MRKIIIAITVTLLFQSGVDAAGWQWWRLGAVTPIAAWQSVGVDSLSESYVDLTGHNYTLTPGWIEPTLANGWEFHGQDGLEWLDTGIVPEDDYSVFALVDSGFGLTIVGEAGDMILALGNGSDLYEHERSYGNSNFQFRYGANGVIGLAGGQPYWNGIPDGSPMVYGDHESLFIGATNYAGESILACTCVVQAVVVFDRTLTRPQVAQLVKQMSYLPDTPPREGSDAMAYSVDLPSGQTGSVLMSATAGDGLITSIAGVLLVVAVFQELRAMAHKSSG